MVYISYGKQTYIDLDPIIDAIYLWITYKVKKSFDLQAECEKRRSKIKGKNTSETEGEITQKIWVYFQKSTPLNWGSVAVSGFQKMAMFT